MTNIIDRQSARDVLAKAWISTNLNFGLEKPGRAFSSCSKPSEMWFSANEGNLPSSIVQVFLQMNSQKVYGPLRELDNSAFDERKKIVAEKVNLFTKNEMSILSTDDKIFLLNEISSKKMSSEQMKARRKIYKSFSLDQRFAAWDEMKREKLINELKADGEILDAREKWKSLTDAERIKILTKVASIQARIYGFYEVPIYLRCFTKSDGTEDKSYHGGYDIGREEISINLNDRSTLESFSESINTITHESAHNMQAQLASDFYGNKLTPDDERYNQAKIFYANWATGGYVTRYEDPSEYQIILDAGYKNQPVEVQARKTGDAVGAALEIGLLEKIGF
ncbi:hypothetical protein [Azospirillum sp. Sh1]|uniref:hypothetical protein n=1 Tax=Azospirillum sp. Sh1 TaxID=2607285 RepID=UPI0011EBA097|nr:hypothetical protein [Azospirillum sp. Sh1]KAA0574754.1 hypothetical protein FZ029_17510 [Azospirillum sp. Sh1]